MSAGLGLPVGFDPSDLARLFGRAPLGAPQGFSGATGVTLPEPAPVAMDEAQVQALERQTGMVPPSAPPVAGIGFPKVPQSAPAPSPQAETPAPDAKPIVAPALPTPSPVPAAPGPVAPAPGDDFSAAMGRFRDRGGFDYLGALGAGMLSSPTMAGGVAAGMQFAQKGETQRAATDLARTELALKKTKLAQEQAAITGNARYVKAKIPGISDEQAAAFAGNSSFMTELLKGALPPSELFRQYTDGDGNVWSQNTRTGQSTVALQAKEDKAVTPVSEGERVRRGYPAGSYQQDAHGRVSPINPSGTTINMGAEKAQDAKVGGGYGEYQLDLATKGRNAASTLNTLALMEQAMKMPGFYSGVGGEGMKRANQFLGALGVKDSKAASGAEVFDALSNKVVLDGLGGSLGPGISNTDRDYIGRTAPTLAQSEQGNRDLIGIARALAQRQQAVARLAREYAAKNGGRIDGGFDQQLEDFAASNPLFPQARQGETASAPKEPPQGAPSGARQAPDGNWYVPDPNRPGKYMRVQ